METKKNNIIFEYSSDKKTFLVLNKDVWSILKNTYHIEENEIKNIIKKYIINNLKIDVENIYCALVPYLVKPEEIIQS